MNDFDKQLDALLETDDIIKVHSSCLDINYRDNVSTYLVALHASVYKLQKRNVLIFKGTRCISINKIKRMNMKSNSLAY